MPEALSVSIEVAVAIYILLTREGYINIIYIYTQDIHSLRIIKSSPLAEIGMGNVTVYVTKRMYRMIIQVDM